MTQRKDAVATPRYDLDAERALLGSVLLDNDTIVVALERISATDCYQEKHRKIFAAMVELHEHGTPIDPVTLQGALVAVGQFDEVGGMAYLATLPDAAPVTTNVRHYADRIALCAQSRAVGQEAVDLAELSRDPSATAESLSAAAERLAVTARPKQQVRADISFGTALERLLLDANYTIETKPPIPTPWPELTRILNGGWTGGLRPYVVAGETGLGKTSFAFEVALHASLSGNGVVFFELELSLDDLLKRGLSAFSGLPLARVKNSTAKADRDKIIQAADRIYNHNLRIDAPRMERFPGRGLEPVPPDRTLKDMRAALRRIMAEQEVGLVVVDYLGKIDPGKTAGIYDRTAMASAGLADLSQELAIPFVVMAMLNADRHNGKHGEPSAGKVRGGADAAQDSEALLLLDRPPERLSMAEREGLTLEALEEARIVVAKHGSGARGVVPMRFRGECVRWLSADAEQQESLTYGGGYAAPQDLPPEAYELENVNWEDDDDGR